MSLTPRIVKAMQTMTLKKILTPLTLISALALSSPLLAGEWTPIAGVPEPTFGITQEAPSTPSDWSSPTEGFYYVHPQHANASDSSNEFGYPDRPRVTIPRTLPPGAVVEVHGTITDNTTVNFNGTADEPIFIRGSSYADRPTIHEQYYISGSYLILENLTFASENDQDAGISVTPGAHHLALRHLEMDGSTTLARTGGIGIGWWGYSGSDIINNILLTNLDIHDIGDRNANFDQDGHGITVNGSAYNIWILNSTMHGGSGDGVQIEAQHNRGTDEIHHIYVANNTIYNNKQTGVWVKHAEDVIISSNHIYDMQPSDSSSGACTGYQYSAVNVWIINNEIHNCSQGIGVQSGDPGEGFNAYYVNNLIYDIQSRYPTNAHQAGAIMLRMSAVTHHIINNTIVDADIAISAPIQGGDTYILGNVFSEAGQAFGADIYMERVANDTTIDDNIIHRESGISIRWDGRTYDSVNEFNGSTLQCRNCEEDAPVFLNRSDNNFTLSPTSPKPARTHAKIQEVYDRFESLYGVPLSLGEEIPSPPATPPNVRAIQKNN